MSIVVRDEADIIGHNIEYHRRMGVDRFVVIDHRSVDGTSKILKRFERLGFVDVIRKTSEVYEVVNWRKELIRLALKTYDQAWHIPNDADEFYVPPPGHTLKTYLRSLKAHRVLRVPRTNVISSQEALAEAGWRAAPGFATTHDEECSEAVADPAVPIELPYMYYPTVGKVVFRPATFKEIGKGCHSVTLEPMAKSRPCDLRILHFAVRSRGEFVRSAIRLGRSAVKLDCNPTSSDRYRRWLKMSEAGVPEQQMYDEMLPRQERMQRDVATGLLVPIEYPEALRQVLAMNEAELAAPLRDRGLWRRIRRKLVSLAGQ